MKPYFDIKEVYNNLFPYSVLFFLRHERDHLVVIFYGILFNNVIQYSVDTWVVDRNYLVEYL